MLPHQFHPPEFLHIKSRADLPHLGLVLLLVSGIILGVYLSLQPQLFNKQAAEGSLVDIQFNPDSLQVKSGQIYEAEITINPKGARVTAAELNLSYNPQQVSIVEVLNAGFLPITLKSSDDHKGNFILILGSTIESKTEQSGLLAKVKFKILGRENSTIAIRPDSQVIISSRETNALTVFSGLKLQVQIGPASSADVKYPNSLLLETPVLPEPSPYIRQFEKTLEPLPAVTPDRIKPQLSEDYLRQLSRDIFIEPILALNQVLQEKAGEFISP